MRTAAVALLAALALAGCTSSSEDPAPDEPPAVPLPAASSFTEGTCTLVAPDVIAVGENLPKLGDGGDVDQEVKDALRDAQDRVFAVAEAAEPAVKPALDELVVALGIVRVRADGNTYETAQGEVLRKAYDAAVDACTA